MKKQLAILSVIIGALSYLYMLVALTRNNGEGLSLSTFALAASLAWITGFTTLKQKASPAVPFIYALGATATAVSLLLKGRYGWSRFDTLIALLVITCIVLWLTKGPRFALVMSVMASAISFIPYIMITWKNPGASPIIPNTGFLLANFLAFVAARTWTLKERLYAGVNIVLCTLLVLPWLLR